MKYKRKSHILIQSFQSVCKRNEDNTNKGTTSITLRSPFSITFYSFVPVIYSGVKRKVCNSFLFCCFYLYALTQKIRNVCQILLASLFLSLIIFEINCNFLFLIFRIDLRKKSNQIVFKQFIIRSAIRNCLAL